MKNYGIEIEIIDKSGKNINGKEFICKINDKEVSENKDGMFLLKEKIEEVGEKNSYKIECADKTINFPDSSPSSSRTLLSSISF